MMSLLRGTSEGVDLQGRVRLYRDTERLAHLRITLDPSN